MLEQDRALAAATPSGRLPCYPFMERLKEVPTEPFGEVETQEFRAQDLV